MSDKSKGKLSLVALILMIFTSVYGFNNIPRAFYMMGYGAIPWYIVGGIFFFLPFAFMVTELGSAFKEEKGGIYSWMEKSVGPTFAFVGTLMWYASYLIWMVNVSSGFMVPLTNVIFGDSLHLPATWILSILAIAWMVVITFGSLQGMNAIKKFTSVGGIAVLSLNALLLIGAILVLILNGGHTAMPISIHALTTSAQPGFDNSSIVGFFAFIVFAIFAYGGVEAVGGLVDETDKPEKNFPRGVIMSALIIAVGYSLMIFFVGFFLNYQSGGAFWNAVKSGQVHLGNASYVIMQNLGQALGHAFGMSNSASVAFGGIIARYMGAAILLSLLGAFFTLIYSPVKQIINGTPEKLWPGKYAHIDEKSGMPRTAMLVQLGIVVVIIVLNMLLSFVNKGAADTFFLVLTNMTNVAMTLPYMLIVIAFIKFKFNDNIEKPFVIYKSKGLAVAATVVALLVVGFANVFTVIQPIVQPAGASASDIALNVVSMIAGPVVFALVAILMMRSYLRKTMDGASDSSGLFSSWGKFWAGYVDFQGRTSRADFWWSFLANSIINGILSIILFITEFSIISALLSGKPSTGMGIGLFGILYLLMGLYNLVILLPSLAIVVRRLRDSGRHWAYIFLGLIPLIGTIVLIVFLCQPSQTN